MSKPIKTEHAGAKNGGGYWGLRVDAKERSRKLRRSHDKDTVAEVGAGITMHDERHGNKDARGMGTAKSTGVADKWREMTLGEVIELKRGYDLPQQSRRYGKVPLVSSSGVTDHHSTAMVKGPGVVTGRYGTLGQVFYIKEDFWPLNTTLYVRDFKGNDPRYVSYFLRGLDFHAYSDKAAVPGLNRNHLHQAKVRVPIDVSEQRAIAHILGTLDDKIELNRRMNETLEMMVRTLFKSWFVDFDPVRAKAEGRDPGLPKHIADLFPDSFEDSEMGEIPKGWTISSIYAIADVVYGAPFASAQFNAEGVGSPLIRIRDLADESPGIWTPEVHLKGYKIRPGDIVVGMDGEFRAYLWGGVEAWLNQRVCVFNPKRGVSPAFVRNSITDLLAQVEATETATTVIHLGKSDIDRFLVVVPTPPVLATFNRSCQSWYDRIVAGKRESRALAALRDTLLPKLISGELRVKAADGFIQEARMTVPDDLSALDEKPLADAERMVDDCEPNAEILRREGIPPKTRYIPAGKR